MAPKFESCVISEGSQTRAMKYQLLQMFESCVISEGSQTLYG